MVLSILEDAKNFSHGDNALLLIINNLYTVLLRYGDDPKKQIFLKKYKIP